MKQRVVLCQKILFQGDSITDCGRKRAEVARRMAKKYNIPFIALQEVFDEACKQAPAFYWLRDGVNLTSMGHWLIHNEWVKAFQAIKN